MLDIVNTVNVVIWAWWKASSGVHSTPCPGVFSSFLLAGLRQAWNTKRIDERCLWRYSSTHWCWNVWSHLNSGFQIQGVECKIAHRGFCYSSMLKGTGWMEDGWMNWWMDGWMDEWMNGWMDEWMDEWMNGWMDEWMNGWMNGWMDGWMDEWWRSTLVLLLTMSVFSLTGADFGGAGPIRQGPQVCGLRQTGDRRCMSHDHRRDGERCQRPPQPGQRREWHRG